MLQQEVLLVRAMARTRMAAFVVIGTKPLASVVVVVVVAVPIPMSPVDFASKQQRQEDQALKRAKVLNKHWHSS